MLFNKESELVQISPTTVKLLPIQVTEEDKLKVQLLLKNLIWFKLVKELITLLMFTINLETLLEFLQPVWSVWVLVESTKIFKESIENVQDLSRLALVFIDLELKKEIEVFMISTLLSLKTVTDLTTQEFKLFQIESMSEEVTQELLTKNKY